MSDYQNELKALQRKHGRHFPTLGQALAWDKENPSLAELKRINKEREANDAENKTKT